VPSRRHVIRRVVQVSALAFTLLVPTVARYQNYVAAREIDRMIERWDGTWPGAVLTAIDGTVRRLPGVEYDRAGRVQRDRATVLAYTQSVRGGPWSAEIGPLSFTDPLAGAESVAASKRIRWVLVLGLLVPVAATILLGRVFCSWICPMGLVFECTDKLRGALQWLEMHPRNVRVSRRVKYVLLAAGLMLTALLSVPVLGYVYPPAMLGRELHGVVFAAFDRAELGRRGFALGGLTWMSAVLGAIVLVEVTISRRWWCRYVCPGGALYGLLGRRRAVRVTLDTATCTGCAMCVAACPMGLNPMKNQMGMDCDNCGECITSCSDDAIGYALVNPLRRPADVEVGGHAS